MLVRGRTLLLSIGAHAVVFAGLASWSITFERAPAGAAHTAEPAPRVELVPIEVALDDVRDPVRADPPDRSPHVPGLRDRSRAPHGSGLPDRPHAIHVPADQGPAEPGGETPARPNPLAMRGLRHDLSLPSGIVDGILGAAPAPEAPPDADPRWAPDPNLGKLIPKPGGRRVVRDKVATFSVDRDGTVAIKDKPYFTIRLNLPNPWAIKRALEHDLETWDKDPYRDMRVGTIQDLPRHLTAVPGACDSFGDLMCETAEDINEAERAADNDEADGGGLVSGKADITGYLHEKFVGDPYASRKLKILDTTRDERARLGGLFRAERLQRSAEYVHRNLEALWRTVADPAQRRAALFAMWDECSEGADAAGAAGERARAMVIGWIRSHLPAGSPGAFTEAEVAALNAHRTSQQPFAP